MTRTHRLAHRSIWPALALAGRARLHDGAGAAAAAGAARADDHGDEAVSVGFRAVQWNRDKLVYDGDPGRRRRALHRRLRR